MNWRATPLAAHRILHRLAIALLLMASSEAQPHGAAPADDGSSPGDLLRLDLCGKGPGVPPHDVERLVQQHPRLEELCLRINWPRDEEGPRHFRLPALPASLKHLQFDGLGWGTQQADLSSLAACSGLESLLIDGQTLPDDGRLTGAQRSSPPTAWHAAGSCLRPLVAQHRRRSVLMGFSLLSQASPPRSTAWAG